MDAESNDIEFIKLCKKLFRFGSRETNLEILFGADALKRIRKKFAKETDRALTTGLRELAKLLFLAAHSPKTFFFTGDTLTDDLWHSIITETKYYKDFCERIRPGCFIHHTGVLFEDYASTRSAETLYEEQCSWLASYIFNFGPIDEEGYETLRLAKNLAGRLKGDRHSVNALGAKLLKLRPEDNSVFNYNSFISEVALSSNEIDRDPIQMQAALGVLKAEIGAENSSLSNFSNDHLEKLFGASTALAFTFWQHLAAVERLEGLPDWQRANENLWSQIRTGRMLCGLATTHLANPSGARIKGKPIDGGFTLDGHAPWVCGYQILDLLLVGFDAGEEIVFSLIEFPHPLFTEKQNHFEIIRPRMSCLNGTNTIDLVLKSYPILEDQIVSRRLKNAKPPAPRPTKFITPEIGIAKASASKIKLIVDGSKHPRHNLCETGLKKLEERILNFCSARQNNEEFDELVWIRDEINRDAVRLLAMTLGAASILETSEISRLQNELLLLDSVLHSPVSFEKKISHFCSE